MSHVHDTSTLCQKRTLIGDSVRFVPEADIALQSITSSARARSVGGMSRPRALAVLRLMVSSYLVGAWTGRSAGFSPLRNAIDITGGAPVGVDYVRPVSDQA